MSALTTPEEFEAAFRKEFGFGRMTASSNPDAAQMLKAAEWAWQASRAALVIELPRPSEFANALGDYAKGYRIGKRDTVAAIEAAGVKVKS